MLLREKIVASASERLIIVVDQEKLVDRLGEHTPVPIEVSQFGWQATAVALAKIGRAAERRPTNNPISPTAATTFSTAVLNRWPIQPPSNGRSP
jgi:ribose 5-phosphate isomerase